MSVIGLFAIIRHGAYMAFAEFDVWFRAVGPGIAIVLALIAAIIAFDRTIHAKKRDAFRAA